MKGARPKSASLKVLQGNPGRRPLDEPKPLPVAPECPKWLDKLAKSKWAELAPRLTALGLLTEVDGEAFALLCQHWANAVHAQESLERDGLTVAGKRNPAAGLLKDSSEAFRRYCGLFGLNPTDRARLHAPVEAKDEDDAFFGGGPDA